MGQKISPLIFRLLKKNNYNNFFFVSLNRLLKLKNKYKFKFIFYLNILKNFLILEKIFFIFNIKLNFNNFNNIELKIIIPYLKECFKFNKIFNFLFFKILNKDLKFYYKFFNNLKFNNNNIKFSFKLFKQPFKILKFLYFFIRLKFKNKFFNFKNIFKYIFIYLLKKIKKKIYLKGLKLNFSGKINNFNRSQLKIIQFGNISLNTINNKIEFYCIYFKTKFGIINIKIWLFKY